MKIGILTQHLHNNYGGLLQAFALQYYLIQKGNDVLTVDFTTKNIGQTVIKKSMIKKYKAFIANFARKYLLNRDDISIFPLSEDEKAFIGSETRRFVAENIRTTQKLTSLDEITYLDAYKFDAFIVGSDQVWRPRYSPSLPVFFLDFLKNDSNVKRIAYAASFGTDNCDEYSTQEIEKYSCLLKMFDGVGVREDSAVELCSNYFSTPAVQVIDPTLLLEKDVYINLIEKDKVPESKGDLMVYVLDQSKHKLEMIDKVATLGKFQAYSIMPSKENGKYPPVTQWLRGFFDAKYVVTDSFHGVVFSIIFNKPFLAIGNQHRGLARFTSFLKLFDLIDRLILTPDQITEEKVYAEIDFDKVNKIKLTQQKFADDFLNQHLG